jgi:hypothetical protein
MKVKMLKKHAWALSPRQTIRFNVGQVIDVPDNIGNEMVKIKWGEPFVENKMQAGTAENKMLTPSEENKADNSAQPGEVIPGDKVEVLDGENKGIEGEVVKADNSGENIAESLKTKTKDELLVFAKKNKIKIPFMSRSKEAILSEILKALK